MQIIDYGPKELTGDLTLGESQNIWVKIEGVNCNPEIMTNEGLTLKTTISPQRDVVTTSIPSWVFYLKRDLDLKIVDKSVDSETKLKFKINNENINKSLTPYDDLLKRVAELERYKFENEFFGEKCFSGWGMTTYHASPWAYMNDSEWFESAVKYITEKFEFSNLEEEVKPQGIESFRWRFWIVHFATQFAINNSRRLNRKLDFMECGVSDGYTAFIALSCLKENRLEHLKEFYLVDSWQSIRESDLLTSEKFLSNTYKDIEIERTKRNLSEFQNHCNFVKGFIPDIFNSLDSQPLELGYLHLDLNCTPPTASAIKYLGPRIVPGGVILFDDYGWSHYEEFREVINQHLDSIKGTLLPLPTGQAIFFKS